MPLYHFASKPLEVYHGLFHYSSLTPDSIVEDTSNSMKLEFTLNNGLEILSILPSLSYIPEDNFSFQFSITAEGYEFFLVPCGVPHAPFAERYKHQPRFDHMRTAVDMLTLTEGLKEETTITLHLNAMKQIDLRKLNVFVSLKTASEALELSEYCMDEQTIVPLSQMGFNNDIKNRICSAVSTGMVLRNQMKSVDLTEVVQNCYNEIEEIYGVWPQAIYAANMAKSNGYVGQLSTFKELEALLEQGEPFVASIQHTGDLEGSPLDETKGHLVVVTGVDDDTVLCNDPAGAHDLDVPISYDRDQFFSAWERSGYTFYGFFS
ncbi:MAG: C39 family peptidase [Fibrobacterales bacterium]